MISQLVLSPLTLVVHLVLSLVALLGRLQPELLQIVSLLPSQL